MLAALALAATPGVVRRAGRPQWSTRDAMPGQPVQLDLPAALPAGARVRVICTCPDGRVVQVADRPARRPFRFAPWPPVLTWPEGRYRFVATVLAADGRVLARSPALHIDVVPFHFGC